VRIIARRPEGEQVPLGELGPGDYLGELSLVNQGKRMCTAAAASPVTGVELWHADFQKLMAQKPQACVKLLLSIVAEFGQKISENRLLIQSLIPKPGASPKV
jgi:CRP-like cAMP-binding protein